VLTASAFAIAFAGYYILRNKYSNKQASSSQGEASVSPSKEEEVPPSFIVEGDTTGSVFDLLRMYTKYTSNDDGTFTQAKIRTYPCPKIPCKMATTEKKEISKEEYLNAWKNK
jgi:hypothetical protein